MNQHHPHTITVFINNSPLEVIERELAARELLIRSGNLPPEDFTLFLLHGHGQKEAIDLNAPVALHENQKFAALFNGPTPVS